MFLRRVCAVKRAFAAFRFFVPMPFFYRKGAERKDTRKADIPNARISGSQHLFRGAESSPRDKKNKDKDGATAGSIRCL